MDDMDLDALMEAMQDVADAHNADDDDDINPDEDPDERDDREVDDEEGQDGEQDEEDYGKPTMHKLMLLQRRLDADEQEYSRRMKLEARRVAPKAVTKTQQNRNKIAKLRNETNNIHHELRTNEVLAAETRRHQEAAVALYQSQLTPHQRRERTEGMRKMGIAFSSVCKEVHPNWREHVSTEFRNRRVS
jgi:hypothetical protein